MKYKDSIFVAENMFSELIHYLPREFVFKNIIEAILRDTTFQTRFTWNLNKYQNTLSLTNILPSNFLD